MEDKRNTEQCGRELRIPNNTYYACTFIKGPMKDRGTGSHACISDIRTCQAFVPPVVAQHAPPAERSNGAPCGNTAQVCVFFHVAPFAFFPSLYEELTQIHFAFVCKHLLFPHPSQAIPPFVKFASCLDAVQLKRLGTKEITLRCCSCLAGIIRYCNPIADLRFFSWSKPPSKPPQLKIAIKNAFTAL